MKKRLIILYFFLIGMLPNLANAFTFTISEVTVVDAACNNGGSLTFNPTGVAAGSTMQYVIYKLPDTTTPYFTQSGNGILSGLADATYRIIATETTAGGTTTTAPAVDATIRLTWVKLDFAYNIVNQACSSLSNVTLNVTTGIAASTLAYSITSGPITFPPQTSNTFTGLPNGNYTFRVVDVCGDPRIYSNIPVTGNTNGFTIAPPTFSGVVPMDCTQIIVNNKIIPNSGTLLGFPLTVVYNFTPPPPALPFIVNAVIPTGNAAGQVISQTIPYPIAAPYSPYSYTMTVLDSCPGSTAIAGGPFNIVNDIGLSYSTKYAGCDKYFDIDVSNFAPPFTLNFIPPLPAGFTPASANASYPGPYNTSPVTFGGAGNPMPNGNYILNVTDACGKTMPTPYRFTLDNQNTVPSATGINNGCLTNNGKITVTPFGTRKLVSAVVTFVNITPPATYPNPIPHNVSASINAAGILILDPVPLGSYKITVVDDCGDVYIDLPVTVGPYIDKGVGITIKSDCALGKASIQGFSQNGKVTNVVITAITLATPGPLPFTLPFNANAYIVSWGAFYMDNLPAGTYTFDITDECGFRTTNHQEIISGYAISTANYSFTPNCGTFDVAVDFNSNTDAASETFWLQQKINATDWGLVNPLPLGTSVVCPPGTVPNGTNSRPLINHSSVNFALNGTFRIIRCIKAFNNANTINSGASIQKDCIDAPSREYTFNDAVEIKDGYKAKCNTAGIQDIVIEATGVSTPATPLLFNVFNITNPAAPFQVVSNSPSPVFTGLPAGTYRFQVIDNCGNGASIIYQIASMKSLVKINANPDMPQCAVVITNNETFNLNNETASILGIGQDPLKYSVTYFNNIANAQSNILPIPNPSNFNPPSNPYTVYARVIYNGLPNCYETTSFNLIVNQTPKVNLQTPYQLCTTNSITLDPSVGNPAGTTYTWNDGTTTVTAPTYTVTKYGETNLVVTATTVYGTSSCTSAPKNVKVTISKPPKIDHIVLDDWTANENSIVVYTTQSGNFEYTIDGVNYQDSNTFAGLEPGVYTVKVNDKFNCGFDFKEVWLLNYPRFFTPNGDGQNDYWAIPNSRLEKDFRVEIFNRFGQLMTSFYSRSIGWDGKFNNEQAISDDYWFIVYRQDGRIYKGHFAMKR